MISGKPVTSLTSRAAMPDCLSSLKVPPVERISTPRFASSRANSAMPVLSETDSSARVEVRRLSSWFHGKFFNEVSSFLVTERIYKQTMRAEQGGGPPDTSAIRAARANIRYHLAYIGWLARQRTWLAGERMSYADLAAAAHLSVADYLGDVPWTEDEAAKTWYARVKSRPSFRPLLAETVPGIPAAQSYADLDF